jgi:cytochrome c oxidase subunit 2
MANPDRPETRRVLIASSHGLFGQGLRSLLSERQEAGVEVVGMVSNLKEALEALENLNPDLIIVDYDDEILNRDEFLARFVEGEKKLRVVLLSLQSGGEAVVYDRRTLAAAQIDDWLEEWKSKDDLVDKTLHSPSPTDTAQKSPRKNRRTNMKHLIIAGILVIVVTALLIFGLEQVRLLPVQASAQSIPIDNLFRLEFMVIAFLFALIVVFMLYSIIVFRRKPGDTEDAAHIEGNTKLEIAWTVAPLATVLFFAYLGGQSLADTLRADPQALEIKVVAQQWSWRFEYPQYGVVSNDLMMPVNKQAILKLTSNDVIHSFWVPEFRVKQDALPGGKEFERDLRITPSMEGEYKVRCAELCGAQHATMLADVSVISQDEFDAWIREETGIPDDPVLRGEKWAEQYGCFACHSVDGSKLVGPTWLGVYGSQEPLSDGSSAMVDEVYLYESIIDPNKFLVFGYPSGLMPGNFEDQLTEDQILDIIEFIKSLK